MKVTDRWYSDRLGQDLTVARWGSYGSPVLLFPTAGGDAEEAERRQMISHVEPLIAAGRAKLYSVDSIAGRALAERQGSAEHQLALFNAFHEAIAREVIPAIHSDLGGQQIPVTVAGASIGAFNALAITCRYPELVRSALCMSGTYAIEQFLGGYVNDDLYFSSPLHFLRGLEGPQLDTLRTRMIVLATGSGRWEDAGESWAVADLLGSKGIPNRVDDWGPAYDHDWPTWWEMLPLYLDDLLP
ncbi:esterase family protein [Humibacillus xanthopallidus]|uniref:Esterase/lipase superfamily enzyme n=1 Tax=Humibacillus xanthopallidus TaxID=412689 RepID=A0A543I3C3_9MICO|nr:alpha/beta hydrolase-fold protein [Humibacillus xanthopallidus]TQM65089.1 esterase/lipase superfamily enzyme [Humibacillus xanthopallidus]